MGTQGPGHIVLYVRELERSRGFYRDLLGFREIFASPPSSAAFSSGRAHQELLLLAVGADAQPMSRDGRVGPHRLGRKVGDSDVELREMLERLRAAGTPIVGSSNHGVTHGVYVLDPDGNELELYIDVPGVDWRASPNVLSREPRYGSPRSE